MATAIPAEASAPWRSEGIPDVSIRNRLLRITMNRLSSLVLLALPMLPIAVTQAGEASALAVGGDTGCAILERGEIACWGSNHSGVLGAGLDPQSVAHTHTPVFVVDADGRRLRGMRQVAVSNGISSLGVHACAVSGSSRVWCWGGNRFGELGREAYGSQLFRSHAAPVQHDGSDLTGITQVSAGTAFTCALTSAGQVRCWGTGTWGQSGRSYTSHLPTLVNTRYGVLDNVAKLASGREFSCARRHSQSVVCWGRNNENHLGQQISDNIISSMLALPALERVNAAGGAYNYHPVPRTADIAAGEAHVCRVDSAGAHAQCWGRNSSGESGTAKSDPLVEASIYMATSHGTLRDIQLIASGGHHTCTRAGRLLEPNMVHCTGSNSHGQVGALVASGGNTRNLTVVPESMSATFVPIAFTDVTWLDAGERHTCALDLIGRVRCWGRNHAGQLGRGFLGGATQTLAWPTAGTADVAGIDGTRDDRLFDDGMESPAW